MNDLEIDVRTVRFSKNRLTFELVDGRSVSVPLAYYPTLLSATEEQRNCFEILGPMVHWPLLDADLSSACLLQGAKELPCYSREERQRAGIPGSARKPVVAAVT